MAHPVITFPQPPPTSNNLTFHQRQQLLRSNRKLTKLLGSAPHLIDYDKSFPTVYLNLSSKLESDSRPPSLSLSSYDDTPRPPSPTSSISSISTTTSKAHNLSRFPSLSKSRASQDALDYPFFKNRPPILRLAPTDDDFSQSFWAGIKLDSVTGSPPAVTEQASDASDGDSTDHPLSPISPPITPTSSRSYTLPVPHRNSVPPPFNETSEPTFTVTSEAATRRLKMERIRRRLGECVPVEAVFPQESPEDEADEDEDYVQVITEKKSTRVNLDLRPRWKPSSAVVAFDVIYECPDEHGNEGLSNGLSLASRASVKDSSITSSSDCSHTVSRRHSGKLVRKPRRERVSETVTSLRNVTLLSS